MVLRVKEKSNQGFISLITFFCGLFVFLIYLGGMHSIHSNEKVYASVNYIKHKVETIEKIELLNLRSNKVL